MNCWHNLLTTHRTMDLKHLQEAFVAELHKDNADNTTDAHTELFELVGGNERMSTEDKLKVYRNNARFSLVHTLEQIYPACLKTLGKDYFRQCARAYIKKHPSNNANLNHYGENVPAFFAGLLKERADELKDYAYLPDLALLEREVHAVYYAADDMPFDFEAFEKLTHRDNKKDIRFALPAAMALLETTTPALAIWETLLAKDAGDTDFPVESRGVEYLCVRRVDDIPRVEAIEEEHYAVLTAIGNGATLSALADKFAHLDDILPTLIGNGKVGSFSPAD